MFVCIPVVMLNDNYMRRSMANKKTSRISTTCQSVDKPLCFLKMGSQGRSPRQGLGAVAPAK